MSNRRLQAAAVAVLLLAGTAEAQSPTQPFPEITIGGRVQFQAYSFDNAGAGLGPRTNIFARRVRIQADGRLTERVAFVIQPSFENAAGREPNLRLRDAYVDVRLLPTDAIHGVTLRVGQEKRPFSRLERTSSNNLPAIERGAGRGLRPLATNNLFEREGFLAHDVGVSVLLSAGTVATLHAGVYNGAGESVSDANNAKSYGVRGTVALTPRLELGASFFSRDAIVEAPLQFTPEVDSSARRTAYGVDAAFGRPGAEGLYLLTEFLRGSDFAPRARRMQGLTAVAAYHVRLQPANTWLYALEPALRIDHADVDLDSPSDGSTLLSAVMGIYVAPSAQFRIAYERQFEIPGAVTIDGLRAAMTLNF